MTGTLPLILSQTPITGGLLGRMKESRPNIAVVYADPFGRIAYFGGLPQKRGERGLSRYSVRYEVDLSDHRRTASLESSPLPSRGDAYFFRSTVDVGFRVTDPAAVVRRNVTDGLTVVYSYLIDAFRPITRGFDIGEAAAAEHAINMYFQHPVPLEEGITIYRCRARLLPDDAATDYLRSLETAKRSLVVGEADHKVTVASTQHTQKIAEIEQIGRLDAERRELGSLREPIDVTGLIRTHLSKHPDDTANAMGLLLAFEQSKADRRGDEDARWVDLVKFMVTNDIIQAVDVERLRKQALGRVEQAAIPAPNAVSDAAWDRPLPMLSLAPEPTSPVLEPSSPVPEPSSPVHEPSSPAGPSSQAGLGGSGYMHDAAGPPPGIPGHAPRGAGHAQAPTVVPVYLVIDESAADQAYFEALDDGLQDLPGGWAAQPGLLPAVRLAILGSAHDVLAHMPVNAVTADTMLPQLAPRPGASLASVFSYLRGHIPRDMDRLKSRQPAVVRPTVYLLCVTAPGPEAEWEAALEEILDRSVFPYAPNIVACGAGGMPVEALEGIAAKPGCHAFAADPGMPLSEAARHYVAFVQRETAAQVRAHLSGRSEVNSAPPERFHALEGLL